MPKKLKFEKYVVTMPDGSRWSVPVRIIAADRAEFYLEEFGSDFQRSLEEDTIPLFNQNMDEIADWAKNNMNWEEVVGDATRIDVPDEVDYQEGWANGEWDVE